ncbi:MAG: sulfatase, partial [bacterium]|nr:sulfatase [bacterium]
MKYLHITVFLLLLLSACDSPGRANIIVIIVDTLRSDHLGCYGYERNTSPTIDSLAAEGVRYLSVTAGEPWTLPSMVSIFTGMQPLEHGSLRKGDTYYGIDPEIDTLTELLKGAGYATAAFFNVVFMNSEFGFHRGFDHFDCFSSLGNCYSLGSNGDRTAKQTVDAVLQWVDEYSFDKPLFLAVHFYDPHLTYSPPDSFANIWTEREYSGEFDSSWGLRETVVEVNRGEISLSSDDLYNLEALYDGEIAYTDYEIGRMLSGLRQSGVIENSIVILVSDHGEEFF